MKGKSIIKYVVSDADYHEMRDTGYNPAGSDTGENINAKDKYDLQNSQGVSFEALLKIYPELREKLKRLKKEINRVNMYGY